MKLNELVKIAASAFKKEGFSGWGKLFILYLSMLNEPVKMFQWPLLMQIEPTLYCNLNCSMCLNPVIGREKKHMSFAEFRMILEKVPSLRKISLVGVGEPLLNPELFQMISYAKSKNLLVGFATNAILLNEDACRKIISASADWINISVDSADKDKFEAIRKGADFGLFVKNIKQLLKIKGKSSLPEISFWFVLMKDNLRELTPVIKLAKILGIEKVYSQLQHSWGGNVRFRNILDIDFAQVKSALKEASGLAKQEGISFEYVNVPDISGDRRCKWPWKACYITAEGFVTPCCLHGSDPALLNFGNIFREDFENIWNNSRYQNFRRQLKSNLAPSICKGCPGYFSKLRI